MTEQNQQFWKEEDQGIDYYNYNLEEVLKNYDDVILPNFKVMLRVYQPPKQLIQVTEGGVWRTEKSAERESDDLRYGSMVGLVVKIGDVAFQDKAMFKNGPWCKVGDWVVFRRAAGYITLHGDMTTISVDDDAILHGVTCHPAKVRYPENKINK